MKNVRNVGFTLACLMTSAVGLASSYKLELPTMTYSSTTTTTKPDGGSEAKETVTKMNTAPDEARLTVMHESYMLTFRPWKKDFWALYSVMPGVYVGPYVMWDSMSQKESKAEATERTLGVVAAMAVPEVGPGMVIASLVLGSTAKTSTSHMTVGADSVEVKQEFSGLVTQVKAEYVMNLWDKVGCSHSLTYTMVNLSGEAGPSGAKSKLKIGVNNLTINPVSLTYSF